jgi:hypothetical protein
MDRSTQLYNRRESGSSTSWRERLDGTVGRGVSISGFRPICRLFNQGKSSLTWGGIASMANTQKEQRNLGTAQTENRSFYRLDNTIDVGYRRKNETEMEEPRDVLDSAFDVSLIMCAIAEHYNQRWIPKLETKLANRAREWYSFKCG